MIPIQVLAWPWTRLNNYLISHWIVQQVQSWLCLTWSTGNHSTSGSSWYLFRFEPKPEPNLKTFLYLTQLLLKVQAWLCLTWSTRKSFDLTPIQVWTRAWTRLNNYLISHSIVQQVQTWLCLTWSTRKSFDLRVILIPIQVRARSWTRLNDSTRKWNFWIFSQNISGSSILLTLGPVALGVDNSD